MSRPPVPLRPPLWLRTSVRSGVLAQTAATALGCLLLAFAAGLTGGPPDLRHVELILGLLLLYLNTHAIGHFLVGRAVGIDFRGFGLRGTDHPADYPAGLRHLMALLPMWTAITEPASRRAAPPRALAAMYAAGETATTLCTVAAAAAAFSAGALWGLGALIVVAAWNALASVAVAKTERGDYAKALRAWRRTAPERSASRP